MVVLPVSVKDCTLLCIVPVTDCLDDWAFLEQAWHFQGPPPQWATVSLGIRMDLLKNEI